MRIISTPYSIKSSVTSCLGAIFSAREKNIVVAGLVSINRGDYCARSDYRMQQLKLAGCH
ncbi:hypothetical protein F6R98_07440 [Candidatus Methylospira mobilis]|uniref:Uncharacterized protein n=1 Tax=Candidatus Methylospira mobilis TaxID=1808979 RepID=A0A5Q0BJY7_9GAMM|nr:hypothetical protein [Candidatus Methylospira mobilis]QFY42477.1 hypothetical protein F6R98_07440 [Candidatus Methylospira mobilis]WNV04413.1 hypothetical protein RP726_18745 [Candidatus Methylospira mobilis]